MEIKKQRFISRRSFIKLEHGSKVPLVALLFLVRKFEEHAILDI